jgi:hypothetical protein
MSTGATMTSDANGNPLPRGGELDNDDGEAVAEEEQDISGQIIEICNSNNVAVRLEKIKLIVSGLLSRRTARHQRYAVELGLNDDFYAACFYEACVQASQLKPILLTRLDDLVGYAKRILEACSINSTYHESSNSNNAVSISNNSNTSASNSKRIKLEPNNEQLQQQQQNQHQLQLQHQQASALNSQTNLMSLYTALAFHLQSSMSNNNSNGKLPHQLSLMNLDMQLKQNLKYQEELKLKLYGLTTTSAASGGGNQSVKLLIEQTQLQLNETIKKYNELLLITLTCSQSSSGSVVNGGGAAGGNVMAAHHHTNEGGEAASAAALLSNFCSMNSNGFGGASGFVAKVGNEAKNLDQISASSSYN